MKSLLRIIGILFSYIYPYRLHVKLRYALEYPYTAWATRGIAHLGVNTKFGYGAYLVGLKHISISSNCRFSPNCSVTAFQLLPNKKQILISIEDGCSFGHNNHITSSCAIHIGKNCLTGKDVLISDNSHGNPIDLAQRKIAPYKRPLFSKGPISIGDNVWIGENAKILGNISIGDGAIIGANAVVTHDVPPNALAVGVPAKIITHN